MSNLHPFNVSTSNREENKWLRKRKPRKKQQLKNPSLKKQRRSPQLKKQQKNLLLKKQRKSLPLKKQLKNLLLKKLQRRSKFYDLLFLLLEGRPATAPFFILCNKYAHICISCFLPPYYFSRAEFFCFPASFHMRFLYRFFMRWHIAPRIRIAASCVWPSRCGARI